MTTFILYLYISYGFGSSSTGGPLIIDNITSYEKCETIKHQFESQLGSKLDSAVCIGVQK